MNAIALVALVRPDGAWTVFTLVAVVVAVLVRRHVETTTRPPRPVEIGRDRPRAADDGRLEPPAVIGLLTNAARVPSSAVTATVLDLARRRWVRLATTDQGEVVVFVRGTGTPGDHLAPFEQQVLNHLTARSFDGLVSGGTLAAARTRLDRRWWRRFRRDVARAARADGLTRSRWTVATVAPVAAAWAVASWAAWRAWTTGVDGIALSDAPVGRAVWTASVLVLAVGGWRFVHTVLTSTETPTEAGERRAGHWLGHRRHLVDLVPESASVVTSPQQQLTLAHATVLGVTPYVLGQLPVVADDPRWAWSDAGELPHVVSVRYPFRPGYGRSPLPLVAVGLAVGAVAQFVQRSLHRVADGEALTSWVDTFPDQRDRITGVVDILGNLMWIPTVWAVWAVVSGLVDLLLVRERRGVVVRVRRPIDVAPAGRWFRAVARRDRFSLFVAVDDGRRDRVTAWVADERRAVPESVQARVSATRLLGHVRAAEPIGTSTRRSA